MDKIIVKGARENNLKNVNIEIPKNTLTVMTGVSGSGKSSLAFDTIYAEGERRYVESLSAYARQFLGGNEKPDVDSIEGLSPAISIDQKTTNKNPRSTVGTVTEIYDYLRLLYARVGVPYCPNHNKPITRQSIEEMTNQILKLEEKTKIRIMSPIIIGEKGTHKDLLESLKKDGYTRVNIDEIEYDLSEEITLDKNKKHNISVIVDRLIIKEDIRSRLYDSIEIASKLSNGRVNVDVVGGELIKMCEAYGCPDCDFSLDELEPRMFSFNAPYGACDECKGLGIKLKIDEDLVIPNRDLSLNDGAIVTLNSSDTTNTYYTSLETVCNYYNIDMDKPLKDLKKSELDIILYGSKDIIDFKYVSKTGNTRNTKDYYEGVITNLERRYMETKSGWIENYMTELPCPKCHGARLSNEVLSVLVGKLNIYELTKLSIKELYDFFKNLKLSKEKEEIARLIIKEINSRLSFLINVGLEYLTL